MPITSRIAAAAVFAAAFSVGLGAAIVANADPNDGSGFDLNHYLACVAQNNLDNIHDDTGCCFEAGGYWYPATAGKSAFCSPIVISNDQSGQAPAPPQPGAIAILPPGALSPVATQ